MLTLFRYCSIILIVFSLQGVLTLSHSATFTKENQLLNSQLPLIDNFWQQGDFSDFAGVDNIRINFARFNSSQHSKCLIISAGRSEAYLKFKELAYDFFQQGFNIFILDHRGQGLSARMLTNSNKGYVKNFDDYADDLHTFVETIVRPECQTKPYLLAHSMGGAIAVRYLQKYPNVIAAAVLSSPMIAFNKGGLPDWLSTVLVNVSYRVNRWFSSSPWYFLGQQDYPMDENIAEAFKSNELTHSKIRFQRFSELYQQTPAIQLGGVTIAWLQQAIITTSNIFSDLDKIKIPLLVLQSGGDTVVDNQAQDKFCQQLHQLQPHSCPAGKPTVINNTFHELFLESDQYRELALTKALAWFLAH